MTASKEDDFVQIRRWNQAPLEPVWRCVHDLFAERVLQHPQAPAICSWDGDLTYQDLDQLSTRLSYGLRKAGVNAEAKVPICFEKSKWTVVAMIAIMKAGGAFVPLDPAHPVERLKDICQALAAAVLLASKQQVHLLSSHVETIIEVSDRTSTSWPMRSDRAGIHIEPVQPDHAAYVLYTSGSTGKPKGCVVEHAAYCSSAQAHSKALKVSEGRRMFQFASYGFDASMCEILTAFTMGACICIPSDDERMDDLTGSINKYGADWAMLTPTTIKLLQPESVPHLRTLCTVGEAAPQALISSWAARVELINGYGPTETVVIATAYQFNPSSIASTLGEAVGARLWVADMNEKRHCQIEEAGELLIETPAMARGYLDDEEKTNASFIDVPDWMEAVVGPYNPSCSGTRRRRLYRTGDIVRYQADGLLQYMGRRDNQLKIRGQRMEIGEIEYAIGLNERIESVAIVAQELSPGNKILVAVLCFCGSHKASRTEFEGLQLQMDPEMNWRDDVNAVVQHVSNRLPGYMVPTSWLVVDRLPTSVSAKLDRGRIKEWVASLSYEDLYRWNERESTGSEKTLELDETETEAKLRLICSKTLNVDLSHVSLNHSFLELGGDSITAMQLVAACRAKKLGLTVRDVLKSESLRQLTHRIKAQGGSARAIVPNHESQYYEPFPLSPIQRFFFERSPNGHNHFNQSFLLELKSRIVVGQLEMAIQAVLVRHMMLRGRFTRESAGQWLQQVCPSHGPESYILKHLAGARDDDLLSAVADLQSRLDFKQGPMLALGLFDLQSGVQMLFATCHHAVVDLVSWRVVLQEIEEHLQTGTVNAPNPLPFPQWLSLQSEHCRSQVDPVAALPHEIGPPLLDFWRISNLPNKVDDIVVSNFVLSSEETADLLSFSTHSKLRTEPVDLLVSCLIYSFHKVFPERQTPTVFNEGHGREPWSSEVDVSRTVGWFTTLLPLWSSANESLTKTIVDIKDQRRLSPANGFSYFSSRYLHPEGVQQYETHRESEIIFNYEGVFQQFERADGLFRQSPLSTPHHLCDNGSDLARITLFEWTATVKHGRLHVSVDFHRHMPHQHRISKWLQEYEALLRTLPSMLRSGKALATRSDFPLLRLTQPDWDEFRLQVGTRYGKPAIDNLEEALVCSVAQEGMLISQSRGPEQYIVDITVTIDTLLGGDGVNVQQMYTAWAAVVRRHPALRTIFAAGLPGCSVFTQLVLRADEASLINHEALPCTLEVREEDRGTVLHLRVSHVAADAFSLGLILRDLSSAYDGRLSQEDGPRYSQYVSWSLEQQTERSVEYWTKYTQGLIPSRMPLAEGSAMSQSPYIRHDVPVRDFAGLQRFCAEGNATLSHVVHAAWALVLQAFLDQEEVCFGYFADSHDIGEHGAEGAVGVFINTLICRVLLQSSVTVRELIASVRDDCIDGMMNQHGCSLAKIQHDLRLGGKQLFNSGVSVQKDWTNSWKSDRCSISKVTWAEKQDVGLAVNVIDRVTDLDISIGFFEGAISERLVASIATAFAQALYGITHGSANRKVREVAIISDHDFGKIQAWNGTPLPAFQECIHHVFKAQAMQHPDAVAISAWDGEMTYGELDYATNVVAHHLVSRLRLRVGERVPLCFAKSRWVLVAILGILKAGGAFVPMEPSHPTDRLGYIATAVGARVAFVSPEHSSKLQDTVRDIIALDSFSFAELDHVSDVPLPVVTPDDTAAILFTSGSSGNPKGCVWQHKAWCSSARRQADGLHMRSTRRVLQFASYSFGASLIEMLSPLFLGATICIISEDQKMNDVEKAIRATKADFAVLPPSLVRSLDSLGDIKTLVCGGETLDAMSIEKWADTVHLIAGYGSTEGAVVTCARSLTKTSAGKCIGRPFNGTCWIVNPSDYHQLRPIGAVGELLIEGPHLAQGYLDLPEKTAAAFVDDAKWMQDIRSDQPLRFYRSGDLACFDPDNGDIIYMGRKDSLVKINGIRVELGESEFHLKMLLQNCPGVVVEAVNSTSQTVVSSTMLFAFVALGEEFDGEDPSTAEQVQSQLCYSPSTMERLTSKTNGLEEQLAQKLPRHMVPSVYVPLKKLPLTASAKIDRVKLKAFGGKLRDAKVRLPTGRARGSGKKSEATDMERSLGTLWKELLNCEDIGGDDDFFRLGGDSLLAMKLVTSARALKIGLTVADIFQQSTLSALASIARSIATHATAKIIPYSLINADERGSITAGAAAQCNLDEAIVQDLYPCSPLQEGMLALSVKFLGSHMAHLVIDVPDNFSSFDFRDAARKLTAQHPILRTRFIQSARSQLLQAVTDEDPVIEIIESLANYLDKAQKTQVELGQSLSRFALVHDQQDDSHLLVWSIHHALYDGWSLPLMLEDLGNLYEGIDNLAPRTPFNAFVNHLKSNDVATSHNFWQNYTQDFEGAPFPDLPDQNYLPSPSAHVQRRFAVSTHNLPGVTLSTLIRAAWGLTCCAFTGARNAVFGVTLTGRDTAAVGIESVVGPTIATVPVIVRCPSDGTVESLLQTLQSQSTAMIPHQHFGLQHIKKIGESAKNVCAFTSLLVVHPADQEANRSSFRLRKDVTTDIAVFTSYALILQCHLQADGIILTCNYDPAVVGTGLAERIMTHFELMAKELTQSNERSLSEIPMISSADEHLIRQWQAQEPPKVEACIHDLISEQAWRHPEAEAVCSWDGSFSYRELEDWSDRLASYLIESGVGPESHVLISVDKSKWQIVTILAILKAGGAFVPIEPSYPAEKIQRILDSVNATVAVVSKQNRKIFQGIKFVFEMDGSGMSTWTSRANDITKIRAEPQNAAYVLYTSGSTGTPKGVVIEHSAFCSAALLQSEGLKLNEVSRVLNFASLTFDAAMSEILSTLILGKTVCVLSSEERLNDLPAGITRLRAEWAFFTPSLLSSLDPDDVTTLKVICCGGEAMEKRLIDIWNQRLQFMGGYGPTECAVLCSTNFSLDAKSPTNIGRGFSTRSWICHPDEINSLVPVGAVGELLLEGPVLARGYLNDKTRTDAAFVKQPKWFPTDENFCSARVYRTGDLAFFEQDGSIVYVGRKDSQVKIRGQRCETIEIERQIMHDAGIRQGVVALDNKNGSSQQLIAIITLSVCSRSDDTGAEIVLLDEDHHAQVAEVTNRTYKFLGGRLPSFMVPEVFLVVDRIPLTVGGKIDRHKISRWVTSLSEHQIRSSNMLKSTMEFHEPSNSIEETLQSIWAHVLKMPEERISTAQSFLRLGGDSIGAMQVQARCRSESIKTVTVQDILQSSGIVELASRIADRLDAMGESPILDFNGEKIDTNFELAPAQRWFFAKSPEAMHHFNQSSVLGFARHVSAHELVDAVAAVVVKHSMLRARFKKDVNGNWFQSIVCTFDKQEQLQTHQLSHVEEIIGIATATETSLHISDGPVFAANLFELGQKQYLHVTAHHLVVDLVSWRIILQDLEDHITQKQLLEEHVPVSFQSWTELNLRHGSEREVTQGDWTDVSCFWDLDWNHNRFGDVETKQFRLDKPTTAALLGMSDNAYRAEPQELMITALLYSFRETFPDRGYPQLFIEGHGRHSKSLSLDTSQTVGWFTSLHPIMPRELATGIWDCLRQVKDEHRASKSGGTDYLRKHYESPGSGSDDERTERTIEMIFNYMGKFQQMEGDSLFRSLSTYDSALDKGLRAAANAISPEMQRFALFDVSAMVEDEQLEFSFIFHHRARRQDLILAWMHRFKTLLIEVVTALPEQKARLTLTDLPLMQLDYQGLDKLTGETFHQSGITELANIEDAYPCSPLQRGMFIAQLKDPQSYMVNLTQEVIPTSGTSVDIGQLSSAWQEVVNRHAIFRSVIIDDMLPNGDPGQVVLRSIDVTVKLETLESDSDDVIQRRINCPSATYDDRRAGLGYDLPYELTLISTPAGRVFFRLDISHILFDALSVPIILKEVGKAYHNQLPKFPGPQYSKFISHIQSQEPTKALAFWKEHLDNVAPCHFPHDEYQYLSKETAFEVDVASSRDILAFCQREGVTLASAIQAAWAIVLRQYSGQNDVCFAIMCSGRDVPIDGSEELIGPCISLLVCRAHLGSDERIDGTVQSIQEGYLKGLPHQHTVSLAEIQQALRLRNRSLFNTGFSFARIPEHEESEEKLRWKNMTSSQITDYDIAVNVNVSDSGIRIRLTYNPEHISAKQIRDTAATFVSAIDGIAQSNTESKVGDLLAELPKPTAYLQSESSETIPPKDLKNNHSAQALQTSTQEKIRKLWAVVLGLEIGDIRPDDHFHELGGDSLAAMRLRRLAREDGLSFTVGDIFKYPIMSELAASVDQKSNKLSQSPLHSRTKASSVERQCKGLFTIAADHVGTSLENIEAVVEATDTQAAMVVASMSQHRGQTVFFSFDFDGLVDEDKLVVACEKLVQHFAILRTAFFAYRKQAYQVVCKHVKLDWISEDRCISLDNAAETWIRDSQQIVRKLGQQLVRFCFLRQDKFHSRLLLELSHAKFDGMSYPLLVDTLRRSYSGLPLSSMPQMHQLVQWMCGTDEQLAENYWRDLLRESKIATIAAKPSGSRSSPLNSTITKTIAFDRTAKHSFTFATILKAAWGAVLAHENATTDVVFGQVVSGRNVSFQDVEQVLGACINTTPVRAQIGGKTWIELLRQLQDQHINSTPYETLGTKRLIKKCTDWPAESRLSTVVHHLNIGELETECQFGDAKCRVNCTGPPDDSADLSVASIIKGESVEISLAFSKGILSTSHAEEMVDMLCLNVKRCLSTPTDLVQVTCARRNLTQTLTLRKVHPVVRNVWKSVFGEDATNPDEPYWRLWDDSFAAAQLATSYSTTVGVNVTVEQIREQPTMALQSELFLANGAPN